MDLAGVLDETGRPVDARKVLRQALRSYQQKEHLVGMERARALLAAGSATERATGCADILPTSA
jgi:hypothetical protein